MPSHVRELDARTDATAVLEAGDVLWQPRGFFLIQEREQPLFSPAVLASGMRACPRYASRLTRGRTSFRPVEIAGRASSWRKDDTRLHVDAFPATPVHGRRILRVFANVNPYGKPRSWRVGDGFGAVADYFAPKLRLPLPG